MKVEIQYIDGDPANNLLLVYKHPSDFRPICTIWDDDFAELLSESEYERFESGSEKYVYNVKKHELFEKAKEIYPVY